MKIESLIYHIHPEYMDHLPVNWEEIFKRKAPIVVEIGFGNGEFLAEMASRHGEMDFVGFELSITSFVKAQKKFYDLNLKNVRLVMVDGRFGLRELFHDDSVHAVYLNFPCPWSKRGYEDRRITTDDFIDTLSAVLEPSGEFELVTDDERYSREVLEKLLNSGKFDVEPIVVNPERFVQTRYERKWKSMGRKIYSVRSRKRSSSSIRRLIGGKVEDVHVKISRIDPKALEEILGRVFKREDKVFAVKGVFKSDDGSHILLKMISSDGGFEQHYNVSISRRSDFWIVKLDSTCQPYRTPAVKWSIREIARILEDGRT